MKISQEQYNIEIWLNIVEQYFFPFSEKLFKMYYDMGCGE